MANPLDQARLTDEERFWEGEPDHLWNGNTLDWVADAATAKAMWWCVDWLKTHPLLIGVEELSWKFLEEACQQAGIERPKEEYDGKR